MEDSKLMFPKVLTVSQVNFYVKSLLDGDNLLSCVFMSGEISNLTNHYRSGHMYFSLKDQSSAIRAVMFSVNASRIKFKLSDGMKVIVRGKVSLYEATGQYQLYVEDMQPDGVGALTLAFEQLKRKLQERGYFDVNHKKQLPKYPQTVALITSPTGAAIEDMKNILKRRFPAVNILICPSLVQGEQAAAQLISTLKTVDENKLADVIIIGRGGGSAEDLWAFNDENLAKVVYDCQTPIVSAVGHEIDFTICDFVADVRAATPSEAAELVVPEYNQVVAEFDYKLAKINSILENSINSMQNYTQSLYSKIDNRYSFILSNLNADKLDLIYNKLNATMDLALQNDIAKIDKLSTAVSSLNIANILKRGFAYITSNNISVTDISMLNVGDEIDITLQNGSAKAKITELN